MKTTHDENERLTEFGAARLKDDNVHRLPFATLDRDEAVGYVEWLNSEHYDSLRDMAAAEQETEDTTGDHSNWWRHAFARIEGSACVVLEREVGPWRVSHVEVGDEESVASVK